MKIKKPLEPNLHEATDFRPRLGRYGKDTDLPTLAAIKKAIGPKTKRSNSKISSKGGGRIRPQRGFHQRVVVKARVVKMNSSSNAKKNLRAHVQYLVRSGVSKVGEKPSFFTAEDNLQKKDINEQIMKWGDDRHHFRFIISPEKGRDLDLEEYTKSVMKGFERDLDEKLTWFATCHYNTDEPHIHVVVRGVGKDGNPLTIAKDYIRHGLRELAQKEATKSLGERNELDLKKELTRDVTALKWTSLDSSIEREISQSANSSIRLFKDLKLKSEVSKIYREVKLQRLQFLKKHDLSFEVTPGVWKLSKGVKEILQSVAKLNNVNKLVSKHLQGREALSTLVVHEKGDQIPEPIRGEVLGVGNQDALGLKKYILVSGMDGKNHFIEPSKFSVKLGIPLKEGQLVKVYNEHKPHLADLVIKTFSDQRGGVFDEKEFQDHVQISVRKGSWKLPEDVIIENYLERYSTRVSSLEDNGILKAIGSRRFNVPSDLHGQVESLDKKLEKSAHVTIEVESYLTLRQQVKYQGATWLDYPDQIREASNLSAFGIKVQNATQERAEHFKQSRISEIDRSYKTLEALDQNRLKEKLKKSYGPEDFPEYAKKLEGVVKKHKILGTGIYEVIKTNTGFFVRKLKPKDSRLPIGSFVEVEQTRGGSRVRQISKDGNTRKAKGKSR